MKMYKQCRFERANEDRMSTNYTVGYIESWAAVVGNKVELTDLDGKFWTVVEAAEMSVSQEVMRDKERGFKGFQKSLKGGGIDA